MASKATFFWPDDDEENEQVKMAIRTKFHPTLPPIKEEEEEEKVEKEEKEEKEEQEEKAASPEKKGKWLRDCNEK